MILPVPGYRCPNIDEQISGTYCPRIGIGEAFEIQYGSRRVRRCTGSGPDSRTPSRGVPGYRPSLRKRRKMAGRLLIKSPSSYRRMPFCVVAVGRFRIPCPSKAAGSRMAAISRRANVFRVFKLVIVEQLTGCNSNSEYKHLIGLLCYRTVRYL